MKRPWIVLGLTFCISCSAQPSSRHQMASDSAEAGAADSPSEQLTMASATDNPATADRKIIYTAHLRMLVKDFAEAKDQVSSLVKHHGGYLSNVAIARNTGERRSGRWQARIPIDRYDAFLAALERIGVSESISQNAQDVTEEFVDVEARLNNKRRLEQRVLELLDKTTDKLKDVIDVERELERVRGEIEQAEGRLRFLKNQTTFTTVCIDIQERFDFVPPETPVLPARVADAWNKSWLSMKQIGAELVVSAVYASPWLIFWGLILAPFVWFFRRRRRRPSD